MATSVAAERDRIAARLGPLALRIEHHGSTSVRGLAAKPVIDIQMSVAQLHPLEQYAVPLRTLGYEHMPDPDDSFCPFFHKPNVSPHTHHVHVVGAGDAEETRTLAFRDYLRAHLEVAREYETLKRRLVSEYDAGRLASQQAYADAKGPCWSAAARFAADGAKGNDLALPLTPVRLSQLTPEHYKRNVDLGDCNSDRHNY